MNRMMLAILFAVGCDDTSAPTECAKVLCADDEYCLSVISGANPQDSADGSESLPECTVAPESCSGIPSCDCLTDCTDCTDDGDGVYCEIATP
jgi:hypothetical protein